MTVDLETWGPELTARLEPALAADLQRLTAGVDAADVVGIGAYTDADATDVVAAVHTRRAYLAALERRPQYPNYFLWSMGEWDLLSFGQLEDDALRPINDELVATSREHPEGPALHAFRTTVWNAVVHALAALADGGAFAAHPDAVRAFEPIDADVAEEDIRAWTARINDPERMSAYDAWAANPSS